MSILWILLIISALGTAANQLLPLFTPTIPQETQLADKRALDGIGVDRPADTAETEPKARIKVIVEHG